MMESGTVKVVLARVISSPFCVAIDDGQKVHDIIASALENGNRVEISFSGVTRLTTAFLNAAVGQLYDELSQDQLRENLLPPVDASQEQLRMLVKVVENAKRFFSASTKYEE